MLLVLALLCTGCVPGNIEGMVKELAKSERSWCLAATGYGVNLKIGGTGTKESQTADMLCGDGGLALKSQGTQIGVPLTIVPQLSVGPPTMAPAK
jgi:hypothetical protein